MSAASASVLERILTETREEVERRKREWPIDPTALAGFERAAGVPRFRDALRGEGVGVIAEFKRRSPSAGTLRETPDLRELVRAYQRGGAVAVSVLTEGPNFNGALSDLRDARAACELPLLRKDFIIDPYQLYEALQAGADAVLLIVAALDQQQLASLHEQARDLGLDVLIEVHDRDELARALSIGAEVVGVNNRDLRDFSIDLARTEALLQAIPPGVTVVSESGITCAEQVRGLGRRGVHAVLVGESLMRASDPSVAVEILLGATADMI